MKLLSLFSGIGAFEKALTNIGIDYELVGFSEIDKWAIESYCAIHNVDKDLNLGDVSKIKNDDIPKADIITYGFPCQDISIAGKQEGIKEGTRSGLLYEAERIIEYVKPKYTIAENVKNLVGKRHKEDFEQFLERLDSYGYNSYWKVLNAKDYGIPQNRERVFIVSIRKDVDDGNFKFPKSIKLELKLKDMLDFEFEDKYIIDNDKSGELLERLNDSMQHQKSKGLPIIEPVLIGGLQKNQSVKTDGICTTLTSSMGMGGGYVPIVKTRGVTKRKHDITTEGDSTNISFSNSKTRQGGIRKGQTLDAQCNQVVLQQYKIRKLTPLECWRLMGFDDEDYWKARRRLERVFYNGNDRSNSQMYKQAGNSIVVNVLEEIFKCLLCDY